MVVKLGDDYLISDLDLSLVGLCFLGVSNDLDLDFGRNDGCFTQDHVEYLDWKRRKRLELVKWLNSYNCILGRGEDIAGEVIFEAVGFKEGIVTIGCTEQL